MSLFNGNKTNVRSDTSPFGRELREIRERLGMSQGAFAQAAGICQSHVSSMERGSTLPGRKALDRIKALPELDLEDGHRLTRAAQEARRTWTEAGKTKPRPQA